MSSCLFCKIAAQEIPVEFVYEDDKMVVFHDKYPKARVHLLAVPRCHIDSLMKVSQEHEPLLGHMLVKLKDLALTQGLTDGFRTAIHTGAKGGQEIFHLHIHLLGE